MCSILLKLEQEGEIMNKRTLENAISMIQGFVKKSIDHLVFDNKKMMSKITVPEYTSNYPEERAIHQAVENLLHDDISTNQFDVKRIVENFNTSFIVSAYVLNEKNFRQLVEDAAIMALRDALNYEIKALDFQFFEEETLKEMIEIQEDYYKERKLFGNYSRDFRDEINKLNKTFAEKILKLERKGVLI